MERTTRGRVTGAVWFLCALAAVAVLAACGSHGGVSGAKAWTGALNDAGFNNDVAVVQGSVNTAAPTQSSLQVSTSDGRFSQTPLTGETAGANSVSGTLTSPQAGGAQWTATIGYDNQGKVTSLSLTSPTAVSVSSATSAGYPFAGNYSGTYGGDGAGTWTCTVTLAGQITNVHANGQGSGSGHLDDLGSGSMAATGGGAGQATVVTFTGVFKLGAGTAVTCGGTWHSTDAEGNWNGTWTGNKL